MRGTAATRCDHVGRTKPCVAYESAVFCTACGAIIPRPRPHYDQEAR